jgi:hypothetical protein
MAIDPNVTAAILKPGDPFARGSQNMLAMLTQQEKLAQMQQPDTAAAQKNLLARQVAQQKAQIGTQAEARKRLELITSVHGDALDRSLDVFRQTNDPEQAKAMYNASVSQLPEDVRQAPSEFSAVPEGISVVYNDPQGKPAFVVKGKPDQIKQFAFNSTSAKKSKPLKRLA